MATDAAIRDFIQRQRVLLTAERDADVARSSLVLTSCSTKLLEIKGLALSGLGVVNVSVGLGGKSLIELERPNAYHSTKSFPPHTFRPGDIARIEENTTSQRTASKQQKKPASGSLSTSSKTVEGVVYKITDNRVIIAVDPSKDGNTDDIDLPERCRLLKLANTVTYDRMDKAIDALEATLGLAPESDAKRISIPLTPLTEVLMGKRPPSDPVRLESIDFLDPSLNDSQKAAVKLALEAPEVALIHGPPGTGKTHTLVEIIRQFVGMGKRVLVCGASNLAVDNLLERLIPHSIPLTRLGHPARVLAPLHASTLDSQAAISDEAELAKDVKAELEGVLNALAGKGKAKGKRPKGPERKKMWDEVKLLRKEYRKREGVVVKSVMSRAQIVLATCHSSGGRQLLNNEFDVLLIDEATQAMEAVCWIPILKAKKLILAGDPMQLPPTVLSLNDKKATKAAAPKLKLAGSKAKAESSPAPPESDSAEASDKEDTTTTQASSSKSGAIKLVPSPSLEHTLFDRLQSMHGGKIKRMLTVQYRMHESICSFPSTTLYASRLESHSSVRSHLLKDLPGVKAEDSEEIIGIPVVFFDTAGCEYWERDDGEEGSDEGSKRNENEAMVVKAWIEKLVDAGVLPSQIAVITPYQAQVTALSSMLRTSMPDLEIGTVDGMQGREKEAVILSLVRSNDKREVGFLKEKRRLNVAMTRPRRHLCVIGDSSTVSTGSTYLKKWMDWLEQNADVRFGGLD